MHCKFDVIPLYGYGEIDVCTHSSACTCMCDDLYHMRMFDVSTPSLLLQIDCTVETRDWEHALQLKEVLRQEYGQRLVTWGERSISYTRL